MKRIPCSVFVACVVLLVGEFAGQATLAAEPPAFEAAGIDGTLVMSGHKAEDAAARRFVELAGGAKANIVIVAAQLPGNDAAADDKQLADWKTRGATSVALLQTDARDTANEAAFSEPLHKATGVWINGAGTLRVTEIYRGTAVERALRDVLRRGGVIGGIADGLIANWLPGTVVHVRQDRPDQDGQGEERLANVQEKQPGSVGIEIGAGAVLIARRRELRVVGEGSVTIRLSRSSTREPRSIELKAGEVADLTQLRRAALARHSPPFPPDESPACEVPCGALVIVGGGGMPDGLVARFIELAGGPESLIVVLPTAFADPVPKDTGAGLLQRAGAKNIQVLPVRERSEVEAPRNLAVLGQAKGIWFGGGRQWRFVDAYENTQAHEAFRDVLRRGGVIGGSSAGATIQGDYLCRGNPLNNTDMLCEGYERGLGFLPGVAIDQHFTQRKRFADMTALIQTYPKLLGIGIDETTAIVVQGRNADVTGRGQVHFYDASKPVAAGQPDYESLKAGERFDLQARQRLPSNGE